MLPLRLSLLNNIMLHLGKCKQIQIAVGVDTEKQ